MLKFSYIRKQDLISLVSKDLDSIEFQHIRAVVGIFFEEMMNEIIEKKEMRILNFGRFYLKKMKDRHHNDFQTNKMVVSKGNNSFRFEINSEIKRIMMEELDESGDEFE